MREYNVHNTAYTALPTIEEAKELSDRDADCLQDVEVVLRKHGAFDKFFAGLKPDEGLYEVTNHSERSSQAASGQSAPARCHESRDR